MKYQNVPDLFFKKAERSSAKILIRYKTHPKRPLEELSWGEVKILIEEIAAGLEKLGIKKHDNVGLLSATCHLWMPCDFGILSLGARTVPMYHNSTSDTVEYIVKHAEIEIVIVRNKIQLQKLRAAWDRLPKLRYVIVMQDRGDIPSNDPKILTLDELCKIGRVELRKDPDLVMKKVRSIRIEEICSIIYTSGTTGEPKGVVLTHKNFLVAALSFYQYVPLEEGMNMLSFLPLAHIFERVASQIYGIDQGVVFTYCEKVEDLPKLLLESQAHIMNVVPRILEKIYAKTLHSVNKSSPFKKQLFEQALKVGIDYHKKKIAREPIDWELELKYTIANKVVLSKVKEKISPDLRIFVVGGAPFSKDIAFFFLALGFTVVEGYGLTETSAPISVNPPWANKPGTVGIPFSHFEVKIAEDGEIICRGDSVFKEYYKKPQDTAEAIDKDAWFHTGDLGAIDSEGYITITGRKKDLIITAGGKNIAPQHVEETLLQSPYINQVVVLGDREKYLAALLVLDEPETRHYLSNKGIGVEKGTKLNQMQEVRELIDLEIRRLSANLGNFEQVKAFHILEHELTIDGGELTPTLKIKRNVVKEKYKDLITPLFSKGKDI